MLLCATVLGHGVLKRFGIVVEKGAMKKAVILPVAVMLCACTADNSVEWLKKAAEQGGANAQYVLGLCYDNGEGVATDAVEAVKWYRKAAEQGDKKAQEKLRSW